MQLRTIGRAVIFAISVLLASFSAEAQPRGRMPRIGVLELNSEKSPTPALPAFQQGLRDLGYVEGKNVLLDYRYGGGRAERLPALAAELVRLEPDVLWLHSNPAAHAATRATNSIPIVVAVSDDLVESGLVASLARPGGNLTGLELPPVASGRRLELLKNAVPAISRVAVLVDPAWTGHASTRDKLERDAAALSVELQFVEVSSATDFDAAFARIVRGKADALMILKSALFAVNREQLLALAIRHRLPTMSFALPFAEAGSLLAYGTDPRVMSHRSAVFVDKVLRGARPADLPIERAAPRLIVNLETASQLGLPVPPVILYRADKVIR